MARASKKTQVSVDKLVDDLHTVIADAEGLLKADRAPGWRESAGSADQGRGIHSGCARAAG